jgi:hypothetical protein
MLLGWIAGTMAYSDPAVVGWLPQTKVIYYALGVAGALLVFAVGTAMKRRLPKPV